MTKRIAAERIQQLPPYLFARIDEVKRTALEAGVDVIDLGVGDPDLSPPMAVIESLIESVKKEDVHHYSSYIGISELREAFARWFERRFQVSLDPDSEVLPLLGSKEGIGHIFLAQVNPGDEVLVPDPGYPVYTAGATLAGAVPRYFSLREENDFLPDLEELERLASPRTKMMWLNYPSNPTAALAGIDVFDNIAQFAKEKDILICHDMAYSEIVYDGRKATSLLETPLGKEVGIEFHSLSKTFSMCGWRVGFAVGNREIISSLSKVKTNLDSGIFIPLQMAAITALLECDADSKRICSVFDSRRKMFVKGMKEVGWNVPLPPSTFYVWAHVPPGFGSMEFSTYLLKEAGIVCTPGVGFGNHGEGFVRISLTAPDKRLEEATARLKNVNIDWS
jgi:LL-diaminopimelate aminotransferase